MTPPAEPTWSVVAASVARVMVGGREDLLIMLRGTDVSEFVGW
jgi:hypothetical protein